MNVSSESGGSFLRAMLFVLLPVFIVAGAALGNIGGDFAAFSSHSSKRSHFSDILFYAPFALAWFTCFTAAPGLMVVGAFVLVPWALLFLVLVFLAPPFGIPGCFIIALWYRYFCDVRRRRISVQPPRYLQ